MVSVLRYGRMECEENRVWGDGVREDGVWGMRWGVGNGMECGG